MVSSHEAENYRGTKVREMSAIKARPNHEIASSRDTVEVRIFKATIALLQSAGLKGLQGVLTAQIASDVGVAETTVLRKFKTKGAVIARSLDWSWSVVNERIKADEFANPVGPSGSRERIVVTLASILNMYDGEDEIAGWGAVIDFRAYGLDSRAGSASANLFFSRLVALCEDISGKNKDSAPLLAAFLMNTIASAWSVWAIAPSSRLGNSPLSRQATIEGLSQYLETWERPVLQSA